jgi:hypothetical protein
MNRVQTVNKTELNHNEQQYRSLTEEQKRHNRTEAHSKIFQIVLERILLDGGLTNASN